MRRTDLNTGEPSRNEGILGGRRRSLARAGEQRGPGCCCRARCASATGAARRRTRCGLVHFHPRSLSPRSCSASVTSSVKSPTTSSNGRLRGYASDITELDLRLREYGEGAEADPREAADLYRRGDRRHLARRASAGRRLPRFRRSAERRARNRSGPLLLAIDIDIRRLEPRRRFSPQARRSSGVANDRCVSATLADRRICQRLRSPPPILILMTGWLAMIFGVFGLSSRAQSLSFTRRSSCAPCRSPRRSISSSISTVRSTAGSRVSSAPAARRR